MPAAKSTRAQPVRIVRPTPGLSEDADLRLFEAGWSDGKATHFVCRPLFLLDEPAALIRKWAQIPEASS